MSTMNELIFIQQDVLPALMRGLKVTFLLIIPSGVCGLVIGITGTGGSRPL
jgi:ABC-type amino acid transport system permease subunit